MSRALVTLSCEKVPFSRIVVLQASCVWLMTMLKTDEFARHQAVSKHLMDLQNAFTALLSEPDGIA